MTANAQKPVADWRRDIDQSVAAYNEWFMAFAPDAFRQVRMQAAQDVASAFSKTRDLRSLESAVLIDNPSLLPILRMCLAPPLAVDRVAGLSGVSDALVDAMEDGRLPRRMSRATLESQMEALVLVVQRMLDFDIVPWLPFGRDASDAERILATAIVADRLCASVANPVIRNAQEARQLERLEWWLGAREYRHVRPTGDLSMMEPGTYAIRLALSAGASQDEVIIPIDCVIQPRSAQPPQLPLLVEAKSAGDFANVNKRRKEEADKLRHLRATYGDSVQYVLLLGGYFGPPYLNYEAAAGIDWVWEHRLDDLVLCGVS